jgi:hypothetical protein
MAERIKHSRLWTRQEVRELRGMATRGFTAAEIGRSLKRSAHAIYTRIQLEGIALTRKNRFSAAKPPRLRQGRR